MRLKALRHSHSFNFINKFTFSGATNGMGNETSSSSSIETLSSIFPDTVFYKGELAVMPVTSSRKGRFESLECLLLKNDDMCLFRSKDGRLMHRKLVRDST